MDGEVNWVEEMLAVLCRTPLAGLAHFIQPQYSHGSFQGHSTQTRKVDEDYCLQHSKANTIGTTELLSQEQIDT